MSICAGGRGSPGAMVMLGVVGILLALGWMGRNSLYLPGHYPASARGRVVTPGVGKRRLATMMFLTDHGAQIYFIDSVGLLTRGSVGEVVTVRYDPRFPQDAAAMPPTDDWLLFGGIAIVGATFVCVGSMRLRAQRRL